ncbi:Rieske (2Fe-2S) protein [Agromyces archimandritae]|uniref:Rieske 2Fe-2S domain-containing protein n=1 Tax=Agromyces archimandritae TaxID=2781962 RepID=A0A975FMG0_9MICO|nr:Rieske 2Fe-2S domain-containing protein [Agromyces archimandritae]QTX04412.1 Rieske 2Fe-2S domain-containing protein [Agromyces archimandritae]
MSRREVTVASLAELHERGRIVVSIDGTELGLYSHAGEIRAWRNLCPHQGGPACQGKFLPRTIEVVDDAKRAAPGISSEHKSIVCPWHGFEFDVLTGRHVVDERVHLIAVPIRSQGDEVIVSI